MVKNPPANAGDIRDVGLIPGPEDPLEEGRAMHFSILAWRIPWTEEPGGLPSTGSQRVGHDLSDLAGTHTLFRTPQPPYRKLGCQILMASHVWAQATCNLGFADI